MELRLKPAIKNAYPLRAVLVQESSVAAWLHEMNSMALRLQDVDVYTLPGTAPNSVYGCVIVFGSDQKLHETGKNVLCQLVDDTLFIPAYTCLYPAFREGEIQRLYAGVRHLLHPVCGLVSLVERVNWNALLLIDQPAQPDVKRPPGSVYIPRRILSFRISPVPAEDVLKKLEADFPKAEKPKKDGLNLFERGKLGLLQGLFRRRDVYKDKTAKTGALIAFEKVMDILAFKSRPWLDTMQQDFEQLQERNQDVVDKLLNMFKNNPELALKYAIPLDGQGTGRGAGQEGGLFTLSLLWQILAITPNDNDGNGGTVTLGGDSFNRLHVQYMESARALLVKGEHQKAAFVYMKLLKNYYQAAQALEGGGFYAEAAAIYLQYAKDRHKAAACFEKGRIYDEAIKQYKELKDFEKVGDLYLLTNRRSEAMQYYERVVAAHVQNHQYLKAALLNKDKMEDTLAAQELLLRGWRANRDGVNCLNKYFSNLNGSNTLRHEMERIYQAETDAHNRVAFLYVLKDAFVRNEENNAYIKEIAYEIIAAELKTDPSVTAELRHFNKADTQLVKDAMRYRMHAKAKRS